MHVVVYSADWCRHCSKVKEFMKTKSIEFSIVDVDNSPNSMIELMEKYGVKTLPQVVIDGVLIGGCDDTIEFLSKK